MALPTPTVDTDVLAYLQGMNYPPEVTIQVVDSAMVSAMQDMRLKKPLVRTGVFAVVGGTGTYDLFNYAAADPSPPGTLDPDGLRILDCLWSRYAGSSDPTSWLFLQGIAPYNGSIGPFVGRLPQAPDVEIAQLTTTEYFEEFSLGAWEQASTDPRAPLVLDPVPVDPGYGWVRYTARRTDDAYLSVAPEAFLRYVESHVCEAMGNYREPQSGVKLALFEDQGRRTRYWQDRAKALRSEADLLIELAPFGEIAPAIR